MGDVRRPDSVPSEGRIAPFDAGWDAHRSGLSRASVAVFAADRGWALLGWDARNTASRDQEDDER